MKLITKTLYATIAALLIAVSLVSTPQVAAQPQQVDPNTYISELVDVDIEVSGPSFLIESADLQHYPSGDGEIVQITSETLAANAEVSFFDDSDTPAESLDAYLDAIESAAHSFELLDRGVSGEYEYVLALVEYDGVEIIYYAQVDEDFEGNVDLFEGFLASGDSFEDHLVAAQAEITVGDVTFMDNIDATDLAAVIEEGGSTADPGTDATPSVAANTVTFTQSSVEVSAGPDFEFAGEPEADGPIESVDIEGPGTFSMVAIGETGLAADVVLTEFSSGMTSVMGDVDVIHEEGDAEYAWHLIRASGTDGNESIMLLVADTTIVPGYEVVQAHLLPSDDVAGSIVAIQTQLAIEGEPLLQEFDADEIASLVDSESTEPGDTELGTPEATEESTTEGDEGRSGSPRDSAKLPDQGDETESNTSETEGTPEASEEAEQTPDTLTQSLWEGELYGHVVEWDTDVWSLEADGAISDPERSEDRIMLQSGSGADTAFLYISIYGDTSSTPHEYLDYWMSDEFLDRTGTQGDDLEAEVVGSRTRGENAAVVIRYVGEDGIEYVLIREAVLLDDGTTLIITIDAPMDDALELYEAVSRDVTIDDEPVFVVFSVSQLESLLKE